MATVERKSEVLGQGVGPTQGDRVGLSGGLLALSLVLPFYMPPEWSLWPSFMVFALSFAGFGGSFCQLLTVHPACGAQCEPRCGPIEPLATAGMQSARQPSYAGFEKG